MRIIQAFFFVVVAICSAAESRWQYNGNYVLGEVLSDLCLRSGCSLGMSGEVVKLPITLAVKTSSPTVLLSAIRSSVAQSGYYLQGTLGGSLSVVRDLTADLAVFVDHSGNVQTVPKLHLKAYKTADSIRAYIPVIETESRRWRLDFYSVSENAAKTYGLDLSHPLAYGNISITDPLGNSHLADSWNLDYLAEQDSLYESRSVSFDLDSSVVISWGTQRQVVANTYINDGVTVNSYDWRQYGIDIRISSYPKLRFDYTLRSPDESTINGSSMLGQDSTVLVVASYNMAQHGEHCFLPFLPFFCKPTFSREKRYFILRLYALRDESPYLRLITQEDVK